MGYVSRQTYADGKIELMRKGLRHEFSELVEDFSRRG